jgi:WD40 repeat protein
MCLRFHISRRWLFLLLAPLLAVLAWLVGWQRNPITHLAFSSDGALLATSTDAGDQGAVVAWDVASGANVFATTTHSRVTGLLFSRDGTTLATSHRDGSIQFWQVGSGELLTTIARAPSPIVALAFTPNGKQLICVGTTGAVNRCDASTGEVTKLGTVSLPNLVAMSRDATRLAICEAPQPEDEGRTIVYDVLPKSIETIAYLPGSLAAMAFSPDGQLLAGAPSGQDGTPGKRAFPQVWDIESQESGGSIRTYSVSQIAFSRDRWTAVTAHIGGGIGIWDWASGKYLQGFYPGGGEITTLGASADGAIATAARDDGQVHLWSAAPVQYRVAQVLPGNSRIAAALAVWLALFAAWATAWVRSGLASKKTVTQR